MRRVNMGVRLQQLRRGFGLSVRTLAAQSGFSPSLISHVERARLHRPSGRWRVLPGALG
jgi:transcriptional regulator with XRE-family HTH domain